MPEACPLTRIARARHWIFDMDGTLPVAVHDFDAIRAALDLPPGEPILEAISARGARHGPAHAAALYRRLDELELGFARMARAQAGAAALLEALRARGVRLGIVTRNSVALAAETLQRAGLQHFFAPAHVIGRESAAPKPEPDGIRLLLDAWQAEASDAVMIGDFLYDLQAGARAGTATVYYDAESAGRWSAQAHLHVGHHDELRSLLATHAAPPWSVSAAPPP